DLASDRRSLGRRGHHGRTRHPVRDERQRGHRRGDAGGPRQLSPARRTNVPSDALANLSSSGVTGGALIIVGEDYGEGSSIMQERSHAFAMKSQIWLMDPRPNLPSIVNAVEKGFELSEATNSPVMLEMRIRACHVHGRFIAKANVRPAFTLKDAIENPVRDVSRIVLPPASFVHEEEKIQRRWPAAIDFIRREKLNEFFGNAEGEVGIVT